MGVTGLLPVLGWGTGGPGSGNRFLLSPAVGTSRAWRHVGTEGRVLAQGLPFLGVQAGLSAGPCLCRGTPATGISTGRRGSKYKLRVNET